MEYSKSKFFAEVTLGSYLVGLFDGWGNGISKLTSEILKLLEIDSTLNSGLIVRSYGETDLS
jgi:hypothetical protein